MQNRIAIDSNKFKHSALCKSCGLCCNGMLYSWVAVHRSDNEDALLDYGFSLMRDRKKNFSQPCTAYAANQCDIYANRPRTCRIYSCKLITRINQGFVGKDEAAQRIYTAKKLHNHLMESINNLAPELQPLTLVDIRKSIEEQLSDRLKPIYFYVSNLARYLDEHFKHPANRTKDHSMNQHEVTQNWLDTLPEKHKTILQKFQQKDHYPILWAKYANAMQKRYQNKEQIAVARSIALQAWKCDKNNSRLKEHMEWAFCKQVPRWHYPLVQDLERNAVYRKALEHLITPESIVFEVGTGTGILAMMAARAGAKHVFTCEMYPLVATAARKNIAKNGYSERITVIEKSSYDIELGVDLPRAPDIFVSEIVDNSVLGEHLLPIMEDAWKRLFDDKTHILPGIVRVKGALVGGDNWCQNARMSIVDGFDLSAFNQYASSQSTLSVDGQTLDQALSPAELLISFDLTCNQSHPEAEHTIKLTANNSGQLHGLLRWMELDFGHNILLDNCPPKKSAWLPTVHYFPQPLDVKQGKEIFVRVAHDRKTLTVEQLHDKQ